MARRRYTLILTLLCILMAPVASGQVPQTISYQGFVRDDAGAPINGIFDVTFSLYNGPDQIELPIWSSRRPIEFSQGVFQANLGEVNGFGASLFLSPLWLGITVHAQDETPTGPQSAELSPRQPLSSVPYAFEAANAQLLMGVSANTLDQSAHVLSTDNPHEVTAAQIGAINQAVLDAAILDKADVLHRHDDLYYLKTEVDAVVQSLLLANAQLGSRLDALEAIGVSAQLQLLQDRVAALEGAGGGSSPLDAFVTVDGNNISIEGANLFITNGSGNQTTENALGNLIVGYNPGAVTTTGSHNLIVGAENNYSSTGALISGFRNTVSGTNAAAVGGFGNIVSNSQAVSVGGVLNSSSGFASVTVAGSETSATGGSALSAGGTDGAANGTFSVRLGGENSNAFGREAVAIGGRNNTASGPYSLVAGGQGNSINSTDPNSPNNLEGRVSVIFGGTDNQLDSLGASIFGGEGNTISSTANGRRGENTTIVGGKNNTSSGNSSLIAGGEGNVIEGSLASAVVGTNTTLVGGVSNMASGGRDVALIGGKNNSAAVGNALVLGGTNQSGNTPDGVTQPATLDIQELEDLFVGVSRDGDELVFSGLNLRLDNGSGQTDSANGLGNFTIGYNELRAGGSVIFNTRTGSHNLLIGQRHNFTGYGGIIHGVQNNSNSNNAALIGTDRSVSDAPFSTIVGGLLNRASGQSSVVVGGQNNTASGASSAVLGGRNNRAGRDNSSIRGGSNAQTNN